MLRSLIVPALILLASSQFACTSDDNPVQPTAEVTATDSLPAEPETKVEDANLSAGADIATVSVKFAYDDSVISADEKLRLNAVAEQLKKEPQLKIQVLGHTDERGSIEYNLALGERRAVAVKNYLISMGATGEQVSTLSMGEEQPVADGHDESAWSLNRRANLQPLSH